jgi:hypothetical protein
MPLEVQSKHEYAILTEAVLEALAGVDSLAPDKSSRLVLIAIPSFVLLLAVVVPYPNQAYRRTPLRDQRGNSGWLCEINGSWDCGRNH